MITWNQGSAFALANNMEMLIGLAPLSLSLSGEIQETATKADNTHSHWPQRTSPTTIDSTDNHTQPPNTA